MGRTSFSKKASCARWCSSGSTAARAGAVTRARSVRRRDGAANDMGRSADAEGGGPRGGMFFRSEGVHKARGLGLAGLADENEGDEAVGVGTEEVGEGGAADGERRTGGAAGELEL